MGSCEISRCDLKTRQTGNYRKRDKEDKHTHTHTPPPIIKTVRWTPPAHLAIPLQKHTTHHDALAHHRSISLERTPLQFIMHSCASSRSQRMLSLKRPMEILSFRCCPVDSYLLARSSHLLHRTSPQPNGFLSPQALKVQHQVWSSTL